MQIESGTTRERVIRTALLLAMLGIFAGWFAYDGWIGYPRENWKEHLEQLSAEERARAEQAPVYPNISATLPEDDLEDIRQRIKGGGDVNARRAVLRQILEVNPSFEGQDAWYYFGPAYRLRIPLKDGLPDDIEGKGTKRTAQDILLQQGLAAGLALGTLYCIVFIAQVLRTRLVLDDDGLVYQGKGSVRWDAIRALHSADFAKKGWVDLVYQEAGQERTMRLDEYHLSRFDEVIDAICKRKGFENPIPLAKSRKASQA